jgi:hypothetical protein
VKDVEADVLHSQKLNLLALAATFVLAAAWIIIAGISHDKAVRFDLWVTWSF